MTQMDGPFWPEQVSLPIIPPDVPPDIPLDMHKPSTRWRTWIHHPFTDRKFWVSILLGWLSLWVYAGTDIKTRHKLPYHFPQCLVVRERSVSFLGEKTTRCVDGWGNYILAIHKFLWRYSLISEPPCAAWGCSCSFTEETNWGHLLELPTKGRFYATWLLDNRVEKDMEWQIINTGVNPQEPPWLSADVAANFKQSWDSEHMLLARVAGCNKVYQIIW